MKLKLAVCIFVAVFLSAVIFKVNQVEYIPEYDSGGKSLQAVNSENITEIKTEAETTTNDESKKDNPILDVAVGAVVALGLGAAEIPLGNLLGQRFVKIEMYRHGFSFIWATGWRDSCCWRPRTRPAWARAGPADGTASGRTAATSGIRPD